MLILVVDVVFVLTVKFNVAALSQPTELVKCAICEPAPVNVKPFQVYGNALGQMLVLVVDVVAVLTVKFNVALLSHPCEFIKCAVCEPAAVNVKPFQE